jgi:hypothetical protein
MGFLEGTKNLITAYKTSYFNSFHVFLGVGEIFYDALSSQNI